MRGAALPREQVARLGFYPQSGGRSAPPTPGDFPVAGKVTKGAPRAAPFGIPRCVVAALFALAYASRRATFRHNKRPICHFEMVGKSVLFFLWFHQGNTLCFQSVARQIPYPRGCREPFYPQPIPLGQKARGSKGARPPSPGVQGPGGPWRIFGDFLFVRKSPGCRAERLHQEAQELPAPHKLPGRGAERPHEGGAQRRAPALLALGSAEGRSPSQDKEVTRGRRGGAIPQKGVF